MTEVNAEIVRKLLQTMLLIRRFEEKIVEVYPVQDMKTPVHLYIGQEAIAAGVCAHLNRDDYVFSTHRCHGHYLAKGGDMKRLMAELYGRKTGCSKGKGGSMHVVDTAAGFCGSTAIVGGNIPLATGAALAAKLQARQSVSVAFFGDGAVDEGTFHESLNFASLKKLPVVFVCENNLYATNSPTCNRHGYDSISRLAHGYNIPGHQVDGNDAMAVYRSAGEAIARAHSGQGPTLLECLTYRWKAHVGPDCDTETGCRPISELESWMNNCPIDKLEVFSMEAGIIDTEGRSRMISAIDGQIEDAYQYAKESPYPDPVDLFDDVWG